MADVYISCDPRDLAAARHFQEELQKMGISCHISGSDLTAGSVSGKTVPIQLLQASFFVILVSRRSVSSPIVKNELFQATEANRIILPVHLDNAPLSDTFHFYLGTRQWINAAWRMSAASEELCRVISGKPDPNASKAKNEDKSLVIRILICAFIGIVYIVLSHTSFTLLQHTNNDLHWDIDGILSLIAIVAMYLTVAPAFGGYKTFLRTILGKLWDAIRGK